MPEIHEFRRPAMTGYFSSPFPAPAFGRRRCRRRDRRRRRAGRRAVDDQHRHGRYRPDGGAGRRPASRRLRDRAHHRRPRRELPPPSRAIRERLDRLGINVPLVGDFHYIGHKLLADHPACAEALAKYRINPGNVGFKDKKDKQFARDRRDGDPLRQAGAHRRQLGLARPGTADPADGREPEAGLAADRAGGHARGDRAVGAAVGRGRRGDRPCRATRSSCRPRSAACRT